MLTYGFFNAVYTEGIPDRSYTADNLAEFFDSIIGDGVSADIQDSFKVLASSGMQVNLNPGFCWIHGYYAKNSSMYPLVVSAAPPTDTRIDAIVLRWSRSDRNILPQVLTGVASPNPQIPQIVRNADTYDLLLGYITLNAGDSAITSDMITDTRADTYVCGIIDTFASRLLPDGSVTTEKLVDGSVTTEKLANGSVTREKLRLPLDPDDVGAMSKWELLWTNASPGSSFAAQTVSLDLSKYDAVRIVFRLEVNQTTGLKPNCTQSQFVNVGSNGASIYLTQAGGDWPGTVYLKERSFSVSTSGVVFFDNKQRNANNNENNVPIYIYGIKGVNS